MGKEEEYIRAIPDLLDHIEKKLNALSHRLDDFLDMRDNRLLSVKEAADILGVSYFSLNRWIKKKKIDIPLVIVGKNVKIKRKDLEQFKNAQTINLMRDE